MKIARFEYLGYRGWGLVQNGYVFALPEAGNFVDALVMASGVRRGEAIEIGDVQFLPPVAPDTKILCAGFNYRKHVKEMAQNIPVWPSIFVRFPDSFVGHKQKVVHPHVTTSFDYEAEIAVVIGRNARRVDESEALEYVAGYTCMAENSARDFQRHSTQATPGKNFDMSGAIGPWIVTADELPNPELISIVGRLNGEEVQRATSEELICPISRLVAYISSFTTLRPGDVIATGTPDGIGMTRTPPIWLQPGDTFEVEVGGVCTLTNVVAEEENS